MRVLTLIEVLLAFRLTLQQCTINASANIDTLQGSGSVNNLDRNIYTFKINGKAIGVNEDTLKVDFASDSETSMYIYSAPDGGFYAQQVSTQLYLDPGDSNEIVLVRTPTSRSRFSMSKCTNSGFYVFRFVETDTAFSSASTAPANHLGLSQVNTNFKATLTFEHQKASLSNCLKKGVDVCYRCNSGYIRPSSSCVAGTCGVSGCALCSAENFCEYCNSGKKGGTAGKCDCSNNSNCATCDESFSCLTCEADYTLVDGVCEPCTESTCPITCEADYTLVDGACEPCTASTCSITCEANYILIDGVCEPCTASTCPITCEADYTLVDGVCEPCTASTCPITCETGYTLIDGVCEPCTASTCPITCEPHFTPVAGVCEPCDDINCSSCSSPSICSTCGATFSLANGLCLKKAKGVFCELCLPQFQCWRFQVEDLSQGVYFFSECSQEDCDLCQNSQDCSKCLPTSGAFTSFCPSLNCERSSLLEVLLDPFTVIDLEESDCWDSDCRVCEEPSFCTSCRTGYKTLLGVCVPDSDAFSSTSCVDCIYCFRFGVVVSQEACDLTSCSVSNCGNCANAVKCIECQTGYVRSISGCEKLPDVVCEVGFFENDRICKICSSFFANCVTCSSSECLECSDDFDLSNGVCEKKECAVPNCLLCSAKKCEFCEGNFVLVNGECVENDSIGCESNNCLICSEWSICQKCVTDFVLFERKCASKCQIENCRTCLDQRCLECSDSYLLDSNQCVPATCSIENCIECSTKRSCSKCEQSFELLDGKCLSSNCVDPCLLCDKEGACYRYNSSISGDGYSTPECEIPNCALCDQERRCVYCSNGYLLDDSGNCYQFFENCSEGSVLSGAECVSCGFGCKKCLSFEVCLTCLSSLRLSKGKCIKEEIEEVHQSNPSQTSCTTGECFLAGRRITSQCSNCQQKCQLTFTQISTAIFKLESQVVFFTPSVEKKVGRTIEISSNSIKISFGSDLQGVKIWTLSNSIVFKAFCSLEENQMFTFLIGRAPALSQNSESEQRLIIAAASGFLGLLSGFFPFVLSLLQMNSFFNLYYIIEPRPSYIFELANKATTTIFSVASILDYRDQNYYPIIMRFNSNAISYFLSIEKQMIGFIVSIFIGLATMFRKTLIIIKKRKVKDMRITRLKQISKQLIHIGNSLMVSFAIQILSDLMFVCQLVFTGSRTLTIFQMINVILVSFMFINVLIGMMRKLYKKLYRENYILDFPLKACETILLIVQTLFICLAFLLLCCYSKYFKLLQVFFLLSGITKGILFMILRVYTKQSLASFMILSEVCFVLFIVNNMIPEINPTFKVVFDTICYVLTNVLQIVFTLGSFLKSIKLKDMPQRRLFGNFSFGLKFALWFA